MASLPAKFLINNCELVDNCSYVSSDTRSLIYRQRKTIGQRFEFRLRSIELEEGDIKSVMAGLSAINRDNDVLELILPIYSSSAKSTTTVDAVPKVKGQFQIDVVDNSDAEIGDFFTFSGHSKAYQVTALPTGGITFAPNLFRDVGGTETLTFNNCVFTCKLSGRPQRYVLDADRNSARVDINVVEAL